MAKPRIFISSTFYDLRHVRADLERFITEMGYDAVTNERGDIPYGSTEALEDYCYKEIENCDILVSIVGGRYGTESRHPGPSISQMEVKHAVELGRQLYVFIEADVLSELKIYRLNKDTAGIKFAVADDVRIFQFLDELDALKANNSTFAFRESSDILAILREQWAGLFQRLLRNQARQEEVKIINALKATAQSLDELVKYNREQAKSGDSVVYEILLPSHPIFSHLAELLDIQYRVYFQNYEEMKRWLKARGFVEMKLDLGDVAHKFQRSETRTKRVGKELHLTTLLVDNELFTQTGELKIMSEANWDSSFLAVTRKVDDIPPKVIDQDDEIPF